MRKLLIPVLLTLGLVVAIACSGEDDTPPSNTNVPADAAESAGADAAQAGADAAQAGADAAQPGPDAATAGPDAGPDAGGPQTWVVQVGNGGANFNPATLTIKAGDTVRWEVKGGSHNVVSGTACTPDNKFCSPNDTNCASAPTMTAGATYSHTFAATGAFPYFCAPHCGGGMVGTVTVTP